MLMHMACPVWGLAHQAWEAGGGQHVSVPTTPATRPVGMSWSGLCRT
jgi:hypothetical protein